MSWGPTAFFLSLRFDPYQLGSDHKPLVLSLRSKHNDRVSCSGQSTWRECWRKRILRGDDAKSYAAALESNMQAWIDDSAAQIQLTMPQFLSSVEVNRAVDQWYDKL